MMERKNEKYEWYKEYVGQKSPKSKLLLNCTMAFLFGGAFCVIAQLVATFGEDVIKLSEDNTSAFTVLIMVFLGAFLTGIGVYDKLSVYGGAGTAIPITGFANSIVSPAMEFKNEGFIFGVGAKMFSIAGPVLVYGISSSIIVGLIYLLWG